MRTGIFFRYQRGERLRDFPLALGGILNRENMVFYDALYQKKLASEIEPGIILWNFGYDGTQGEYGDIGLSKDCHLNLAQIFKAAA